jgi:transposase InsO family protein
MHRVQHTAKLGERMDLPGRAHSNSYEALEHLRANIEEFIGQYYDRQRLHSALGYRSPEEQAGGCRRKTFGIGEE